ncbi:MAG: type II secretion system protein [Gammaproteobacteria bacterium]|nr:type II secretion system protein [Gammaproteobacteria bacterium]
MPILTVGKPRNNQRGFTYVMVLVAVVALGIVVETATIQTSHIHQREREEELLFRGQAYQHAIRAYYASGKITKTYPKSLEDLLTDPRAPNRHYLRALYSDPFARGKGEWVLMRATDGGIMGVVSQCTDIPLKKNNFPIGLEKFETAKTYAEWMFDVQAVGQPSVAVPATTTVPNVNSR